MSKKFVPGVDPVTGEIDEYKRYEFPDPTPIAPPVGYQRHKSLAEQIRDQVRSEALAHAARNSGHETFEESEDFDVGDDYDPRTPYEAVFDPVEEPEPAPTGQSEVSATTPANPPSDGPSAPATGPVGPDAKPS